MAVLCCERYSGRVIPLFFFPTPISFCPMEPLNHDEFHIFHFESNGSNFSFDLT